MYSLEFVSQESSHNFPVAMVRDQDWKSNPVPLACLASALPSELVPHNQTSNFT